MFGSKLRAWMEAVRPKKKQHRKEKQGKNVTPLNGGPNTSGHSVTWKSSCLLDSERKNLNKDPSATKYLNPSSEKHNVPESQVSRYSANNLSSPESAYSTGYSTDGTSPGGAPPDYLIKSSDSKIKQSCLKSAPHRLTSDLNKQLPCSSKTLKQFPEPSASPVLLLGKLKDKPSQDETDSSTAANPPAGHFGKLPEPVGLISPRQRNRIRTNPWLPGGSTSNVASPLPPRQEVKITPISYRKMKNSPYLSPSTHRRSLSSSSCSSISAGPGHSIEHRYPRSLSDEDDCTLNEMMGKYDESYVYEKETDILSDSDPTDCESDIDTGQDGGDEEDNGDEELDFIDNGERSSYVEVDSKTDNKGHCMYIIPSDIHRKRSSRRRTTRRNKETSERRRRSNSNKKNHKHFPERARLPSLHLDGSKSAGATPVSIRKSNIKSGQYKIHEEILKKRSNSVCLQRDVTILIERRDREADKKYKELIGQAEQIIRTMNINGLSPRRVPGPTNKRVELLRSTECAKPEVLFLGKTSEETSLPNSNIPPSTVTFKNTRFSPKKNHITNFIINNSPVLIKKEYEGRSPLPIRATTDGSHQSPFTIRRFSQQYHEDFYQSSQVRGDVQVISKKNSKEHCDASFSSSICSKRNHKLKGILHKNESHSFSPQSPRHKAESRVGTSSSEEDAQKKYRKRLSKSCPQSEPMRRKVYFGRNTINISKNLGKAVAFDLAKDSQNPPFENKVQSSENLRHQVLLNTIQNLKRNLEDHSATLQQTYRSTQNMYKY